MSDRPEQPSDQEDTAPLPGLPRSRSPFEPPEPGLVDASWVPPTTQPPLDVEEIVAAWRRSREDSETT